MIPYCEDKRISCLSLWAALGLVLLIARPAAAVGDLQYGGRSGRVHLVSGPAVEAAAGRTSVDDLTGRHSGAGSFAASGLFLIPARQDDMGKDLFMPRGAILGLMVLLALLPGRRWLVATLCRIMTFPVF
jgi:hypothetical protein